MNIFIWFFVSGFLNGTLIWIREQMKEAEANAHQPVQGPPGGNPWDASS